MKRKKLLEIADMLEKFKKSKSLEFDMDQWKALLDPYSPKCGAVYCAIGLAIEKGILPFKLTPNSYYCHNLSYKGFKEWNAIAHFLSISAKEVRFLFDTLSYSQYEITKNIVAKRIREFVKEKR